MGGPTKLKRKIDHPARRVALVSGAGRRLGEEIALALGSSGFDIAVVYNSSREGAEKVVARLRDGGASAAGFHADISNPADVRSLIRKIASKFGRIDVLVNNAAVFFESPFVSVSEESWDRLININLKGTFLLSQAVSQVMLKQRSGRIITLASIGGLQAWAKYTAYSVSKAGVIMLTKCMAKALAPHIMVNAIAPGTILMEGDRVENFVPIGSIPLKRYGAPEDITSLVLFLANTSSYITGQIISVDGGRSVQ